MSTGIAINGQGRIGRAVLKLVIDEPALERVAINDPADIENLADLLRYRHGVRALLETSDRRNHEWYDNACGHANQLLREALALAVGR
jgi:glyceraldehyde-3-phosphate dehydrogenase/erythrose-4-phosphate dehydrogenase